MSGRLPNRIPAAEAQARRWDLPRITDGEIVEVERDERQDAPDAKAQSDAAQSAESAPATGGTLTAQALEEITQAAHAEGYVAGKTEGYEAGLASGRADGERMGRELGRKQAYDETRAELDAQIARLKGVVEHLMLPVAQQESELERIIQEAVLQMTRAIVGRELQSDSSHIARLVQTVLQSMPYGAKNIALYLHSEDIPHLASLLAANPDWEVRPDDSVGLGGCRLETAQSMADYSVARRLDDVLTQWMYQPAPVDEHMAELTDELGMTERDA